MEISDDHRSGSSDVLTLMASSRKLY